MKKNKFYDNTNEVVRLCATCAKAAAISVTGDYLCKKYGIVKRGHVCRKYKLNENLAPPPRRRIMDTGNFNISDFKV